MQYHFRKLNKWGLFLLVFLLVSLVFAGAANACRMWGMVSDTSQASIVQEQLTNFRVFGTTNVNGWAMGYFFGGVTPSPLVWPIIRRGGPQANLDPDYLLAMNEMIQQGTKAALAHVRQASSGASGIPDPHPFTEPGWMFCHNGTIDTNTLIQLIGTDYLNQHKPDYTSPYIDSELFFIYLMKTIQEWPYADEISCVSKDATDEVFKNIPNETIYIDYEAAIGRAVSNLDAALNQINYPSRLTFLLTNGKKLWGCRYADTSQDYYTLYYSMPIPGNNWTVASEPVSGGQWTLIPMYNVVTFQPGMRLVYTEILHQ